MVGTGVENAKRGKRFKLFCATQTDIAPPTIVLFVSDPAAIHFSYLRYLENRLRKAFGFEGTPLKLITRERTRENS